MHLEICNLQGRSLYILADGPQNTGRHTVQWDRRSAGRPAASGVYLIRLRTRSSEEVRRIVLAR